MAKNRGQRIVCHTIWAWVPKFDDTTVRPEEDTRMNVSPGWFARCLSRQLSWQLHLKINWLAVNINNLSRVSAGFYPAKDILKQHQLIKSCVAWCFRLTLPLGALFLPLPRCLVESPMWWDPEVVSWRPGRSSLYQSKGPDLSERTWHIDIIHTYYIVLSLYIYYIIIHIYIYRHRHWCWWWCEIPCCLPDTHILVCLTRLERSLWSRILQVSTSHSPWDHSKNMKQPKLDAWKHVSIVFQSCNFSHKVAVEQATPAAFSRGRWHQCWTSRRIPAGPWRRELRGNGTMLGGFTNNKLTSNKPTRNDGKRSTHIWNTIVG